MVNSVLRTPDGSSADHTASVERRGRRVAKQTLRACLELQHSRVEFAPGARTGVLVSLILLVALAAGQAKISLSMALGALFIAILDSTEAPMVRLRSMLWGLLWVALGVLIGGVVSDFATLHVLTAIVIAAACGYAGALGPRGGLVGVLTLVLFAVYAGDVVGVGSAVEETAYFLIGGMLTIVVNMAMVPLRRLASVRTSIVRVFAELDQATRRRGMQLAAPTVSHEIGTARSVLDHRGCGGETAAWGGTLLSGAERLRLVYLALMSQNAEHHDYVDAVVAGIGRFCGAVAKELGGPLGTATRRQRSRTRRSQAELAALAQHAPTDALADLISELMGAVDQIVLGLDAPWPIGRRAVLRPTRVDRPPVWSRLRDHAHVSDAAAEHALRLAIAFGGATIAAVLVDLPHSYWMPLTVAWVAKPDLSSTVSRVSMRVMGTMGGIIAVPVVIYVAQQTPFPAVALSLAVGAAAFLTLAYLWANYPIAVIGITSLVLLLEHLTGDNADYDIIARLTFTVIAGLWVVLVASIRPRRGGSQALASLVRASQDMRAYASAVQSGEDIELARHRLLDSRTTATDTLTAYLRETPGLWERAQVHLEPETAVTILTDLITVGSAVLTEEILERHGHTDAALWPEIDRRLDDADSRLAAATAEGQPAGRGRLA